MAMTIAPTGSAANNAGPASAPGVQQPARAGGPARSPSGPGAPGDPLQLSPAASDLVGKLRARDTQVRAHEAAHIAAGGSLIQGGPSYSYQRGPDGKDYAVGGEVAIDTSPVARNPRATIAKAHQIVAAALAPADPSGQDEAVAGKASGMAAAAESQLAAAGPAGRGTAPGSLLDVTG
jgi:hypothetical protein